MDWWPESVFSRGHATLHLAVSVRPTVRHIYELRAVFALLPLPNHPRVSCRVSGLVLAYEVYMGPGLDIKWFMGLI